MKRLFYALLRLSTLVMMAMVLAPLLRAQELATLEAGLDRLDARLSALRDISDIEKLQRSYGYYMDQRQWHDVRELFAQDAVFELGSRGRFIGRQRIFEFLRTSIGAAGPVQGELHEQLQLQGIVTLQPDGRSASGRWSSFVVSSKGWGDLVQENRYIKEDGVWKIASLHAMYNMQAAHDTGWLSDAVPDARPESLLPAPDLPPSQPYLSFPSYQMLSFHYPNPVTGRTAAPPDPAAGGVAFGKR